jgi:catechol 2,3-dioxygenase-like lactoylglutathione lyase family enzyme
MSFLAAFRTLPIAAVIAATAFAQAPAPGPAPAGIVTGVGNFSHIVTDLDKSFAFYRDVIGLEPNQTPAPYGPTSGNPAIMDMGNTPGAQSRIASLRIPGSALGLELIEYKDIDRKAAKPHFQDPGAANLVLTVRDIAPILTKLKASEGRVQSIGAAPDAKVIFLQDPDGFFIELSQREVATTAPATSNVIGGAAEIMVENLDETMKLWRDVLKFDMSAPTAWDGRAEMMNTAGTPGAEFRRSIARIPGTNVSMFFLEFRKIERKKVANRTQDPGQAIIQLNSGDLDGLLAAWKAAGGEVVSKGGVPASLGGNFRLVLLKDMNGMMVEVLPGGLGGGAGKGKGKAKQ